MRIIAIPGLGGSRNVFEDYPAILPGFEFQALAQIDIEGTKKDLSEMLADGKDTIILANCYGAQVALSMRSFPNLKGLAIIEPYFAEHLWWRIPALWFTEIALVVCRMTDAIGIKRTRFATNIDYRYLARYPIWIQPLFDVMHQSLTAYALKIRDILTYRFPSHIETPTLLIFSPGGYARTPRKRGRIMKHFASVRVLVTVRKTHNIVTVSCDEIARGIVAWYEDLI